MIYSLAAFKHIELRVAREVVAPAHAGTCVENLFACFFGKKLSAKIQSGRSAQIIVFFFISLSSFAQFKYDTIIDRGIYKSYFNRSLKQPVAVVYHLYHGGGDASRDNDHFTYDESIVTLNEKDYHKSGYDRGHMVPAEDFAYSDSLQAITFRYYNCVPQQPKLNRGKWKKCETTVRKLSQKDTVFVVCVNEYKSLMQGNMQIPERCYKSVYDRFGNLLFDAGFTNSSTCIEVPVRDELKTLMKKLSER